MSFSVVIPTRGNVDLSPIIASYDGIADEVLIWDNSQREDLAVYGRYQLIQEAKNNLIFTQDDDCLISDPIAIVNAWLARNDDRIVVCNMPPEFRHSFYKDHALVGFGAAFHRDAPERAFQKFTHRAIINGDRPNSFEEAAEFTRLFRLTCDIVFTALTPRVLVHVPKTNLPWANASNRMYRQSWHQSIRSDMLKLAKAIA